jgi:hypothetical protein
VAIVAVLAWFIANQLSGPSANELLAQETLSSCVRSLMANHVTDVLSSDQHAVQTMVQWQAGFLDPVKDLTDEGFA